MHKGNLWWNLLTWQPFYKIFGQQEAYVSEIELRRFQKNVLTVKIKLSYNAVQTECWSYLILC